MVANFISLITNEITSIKGEDKDDCTVKALNYFYNKSHEIHMPKNIQLIMEDHVNEFHQN